MKLDLNEDEALVFFEWLSRLDERDVLEYEDPAEREVLWILHGQLEKVLSQPFRPNYRELVVHARSQVSARRKSG